MCEWMGRLLTSSPQSPLRKGHTGPRASHHAFLCMLHSRRSALIIERCRGSGSSTEAIIIET